MKRLIISLAFIVITLSLFSQQLPLYSQYMFNKMLINPGVTGSENSTTINLTARQQWVGIDNAPSTQVLSANTLLKNGTMGVGGMIYSDRFGSESRIGIQANYAYIISINNDTKLNFGLAFQMFQYQLDYTEMVAIDVSDPIVNGYSKETCWLPESDFGIYLYNPDYYIGLSANQMIELPVKIASQEVELNRLARHYNFMGGYKFQLNGEFALEPSLLVKSTFKNPVQLDINAKTIYKKDYWLGLSYRTDGAIVTMLGLSYEMIDFGLAIDFATSQISPYQNGSYEIFVSYTIQEGIIKSRSSY